MTAPKVLVIVGSARSRRICPEIAAWVAEVGRSAVAAEFEIVDLKDWALPMDNEPGIPAAGGEYASEQTRAWSRKVSEGAGVVFVTPQYNWGYPAPLKNALDHLYNEWSRKPAMIVTYGGHSGDKCSRQLRQVLDGLHMRSVSIRPGFALPREQILANTGVIMPAVQFAKHERSLRRAFAEFDRKLHGARVGTWWWPW
jgi:NAD(P)H-dependent FMN reductase